MKDKEDIQPGLKIRLRQWQWDTTKRRTITRNSPYKVLLAISCLIFLAFWTTSTSLPQWRQPPPPKYASWNHEIAALVTELYELLEQMSYIKAGAIQYPPHAPPNAINTTLTTYLALTPDATSLLQLLPYVKSSPSPYFYLGDRETDNVISGTKFQAWEHQKHLLLGTKMADMRDDDVLRSSRDPWGRQDVYKDIDVFHGGWSGKSVGGWLEGWQIALSSNVNLDRGRLETPTPEASVMVLDVDSRRLYTVSADAFRDLKRVYTWWKGSVDPVTRGQLAEGHDEYSDPMVIETHASRPATEALRNYIARYRSLEWIPGYREGAADQKDRGYFDNRKTHAYPRDVYKALYKKHGWPKKFNASAFDKARIAWDKHERTRCVVGEPIQVLEWNQRWLSAAELDLKTHRQTLKMINSLDLGAQTKLWDPVKKEYDGKTKEQTLELIEQAQLSIEHNTKLVVEWTVKVKEVPAWAKKEHQEIVKKYGRDERNECHWNTVNYESALKGSVFV